MLMSAVINVRSGDRFEGRPVNSVFSAESPGSTPCDFCVRSKIWLECVDWFHSCDRLTGTSLFFLLDALIGRTLILN
jgi:hypothetical protein